MQPLFSVVIPTFNRWPLIKDAVDSALNQSCTDREVIVVDDGSTDETAQQLSTHYGDRITVLIKPNGGVSTARNLGADQAQGRYIAYLDSDDTWELDRLEIIANVLHELGEPRCFLFCDFRRYEMAEGYFYSETNTQLFPRLFSFFKKEREGVYLATEIDGLQCVLADYPFFPSTFILHQTLHHTVRWDPTVRYSEDFNFVLSIARLFPMIYLDYPLTTIRMHSTNKSANWKAKLYSHLQTLQGLDASLARSPERHATRRALGRRNLGAARQLAMEGEYTNACKHFWRALQFPEYYLTALRNLLRPTTKAATAAEYNRPQA